MGSQSAPAAPDPYATAAAQTGSNIGTTEANQLFSQVDQVDPSGSTLNYNQTGSSNVNIPGYGEVNIPQYTATDSLSAPEQSLFNSNLSNEQNISNLGGSLISNASNTINNVPNLDQYQVGSVSPMQQYNAQTYNPNSSNQYLSNSWEQPFNQQWNQQAEQNDQTLADQGITPGSAAYNNAQNQFSNQEQTAWNTTNGQAQQQATTEAQNAFNMDSQNQQNSASLNNQSALNAYSADLSGQQLNGNLAAQNYELPLNSLTSLLSGSQIGGSGLTASTTPNYQNITTPSMAGTNISQDIQNSYQDQLQSTNANNNQNASMFSGLGTAASGLLSLFSDRRLKTDIKRIGKLENTLNIYSYRYIWDSEEHIGLMADEVLGIHPDAVIERADGFLMVDYTKAIL